MSATASHGKNDSFLDYFFIMGNDGGSIPDRRDLVRNKPKVCRILRGYGMYLNGFSLHYRPNKRIRLIKLELDGSSVLYQR